MIPKNRGKRQGLSTGFQKKVDHLPRGSQEGFLQVNYTCQQPHGTTVAETQSRLRRWAGRVLGVFVSQGQHRQALVYSFLLIPFLSSALAFSAIPAFAENCPGLRKWKRELQKTPKIGRLSCYRLPRSRLCDYLQPSTRCTCSLGLLQQARPRDARPWAEDSCGLRVCMI